MRTEPQKRGKADITDGMGAERARVWMEATRSAFRVSSKTVTEKRAGSVQGATGQHPSGI